jgi:NAD(P)-dependent dehydrogenase (short-subunit alcohol dehydrogenase family)
MLISDLHDLSGQVACVTGAGGGLGLEFCEVLAEAGAHIAAIDVDLGSAEAVVDRLLASGYSAIALGADVSDVDQVESAFDAVDDAFGRIDVLVNNAGIADPNPTLAHEYSVDDWRRVMGVNLDGVFFCARAALRRMREAHRGKVINVASMWGLAGSSSVFPMPGYTASKGAVVNLTRELALEYATEGIQVNALCPGFFWTSLGPYDDAEFYEAVTGFTPMGRVADPAEIRGAAIFLASRASDFVTGHALVIDGGCLAK